MGKFTFKTASRALACEEVSCWTLILNVTLSLKNTKISQVSPHNQG